MSHSIFLSHTHSDKPLVEPVAVKLAEIFGQDQVFYDSWSIQPGDGIIEKMNKGLEVPDFVFFFVSANSLNSGMVKLEWQNALYAASKGKTRIVPVRVDGTEMPSVLRQTLYVDMHTIGLEAAVSQIVSVAQGQASFTRQHDGFSNLSFKRTEEVDNSLQVVISASHLMEPNPNFALVVTNSEDEVNWRMTNSQPFIGGFSEEAATLPSGRKANVISMKPMSGSITPAHPLRITLRRNKNVKINLVDVLHEKAEGNWVPVPEKF